MRNILKEPLLQFILIGIALFVVYGLVTKSNEREDIVIDSFLIDEMSTKWEMQWKRKPSIEELIGLVNSHLQQEVMYREALAMNLDHNDEIIKRRLAQKMEFISDELAESLQPTREMLIDYLEEHKNKYSKPAVYSLKQIYFNQNVRDNALKDAKTALSSNDIENSGDKISLPKSYSDTDASKIAIDFGTAFSDSLETLPIGEWAGPIQSGFGPHLVFIESKRPSGFYTFDEISEKVTRDYNFDVSNDFKNELIKSFLKNYSVKIDVENTELKHALNETF